MSRRISLTRIIAINWYGFHQIIDVSDNALISGAFGTGKSALLDLMQYVLLGENWRANRAAAGNARGRDLVGYCLGDTNQTRDGQRHFLRQNGVTLVALEFSFPTDKPTDKPERQTWGIRLQYNNPTASPSHTYFYIPDRLDYAEIAPNHRMLPDDEFRGWLRLSYGNDCLFPRQKDYLAEMAAPRHLNFDPEAFYRTFPKAIAFELEENVEKFIREFILEESPIDVREVRSALRAYEDTRKRLEKQEDEAVYLRNICELHSLWQETKRREALLNHTKNTLKEVQAEEKFLRLKEQFQRLEAEHAQDIEKLQIAEAEFQSAESLLEAVQLEFQRDPDASKLDDLYRQQRELKTKVTQLKEAQKTIREQLNERHLRWTQWLKRGSALPLDNAQTEITVPDSWLISLREGSDSERLQLLPKLAERFSAIWDKVRDLCKPLQSASETCRLRLKQLTVDLDNLSKNQAPGSYPLFQAVRQKLGERVEQLGRLIEVKPEAENWWPALELFLGRDRWTLVVNEMSDYREALEILRKTPPGKEGESLLNPYEARQLPRRTVENSLFTKINVSHPVARLFIEHLLGDVRCVDSAEELESAEAGRAIAPEGILKQTPLRHRLKPAGSVELTLGREGLARMRAAKEKEQIETKAEWHGIERKLEDIRAWLEAGQNGGLRDGSLPDRAGELSQLPELEARLEQCQGTIELLSTPEREQRQARYEELKRVRDAVFQGVTVTRKQIEEFKLRHAPLRESLERAGSDASTARLIATEDRVLLGQLYSGILDSEVNEMRDSFLRQYADWETRFSAAAHEAGTAQGKADEAKARRNSGRLALTQARDAQGTLRHPEYQIEFDLQEDNNDAWFARLQTLETIELEKSRQLASDRKQEWERRLEGSVLNELNRRLDAASDTIRLLDRYLGQPVGKHRYRISQERDTAGYGAIWGLLSSGFEPTDPFAEMAKTELMRAVNAETDQDRSCKLLDYRNYHRYDIKIYPADDPQAPPVSLARSGRNLSGGEGQVPFFLSMLAAFRRVYDRGDRASSRSRQLGLVVMDEAFSKLSGDGIEDCLSLAASFQLQLVMAFPPERLGVMVPHSQTVIICRKEIERDAQGYVTNITNIPLLTSMTAAMEALS